MREGIIALLIGVIAGVVANQIQSIETQYWEISDGDILSLIQLVLIIYLLGAVRHIQDAQDARPRWARWLPRW